MIMLITLLPGIIIILIAILFELKDMGKVKRQLLLGVTLPIEALELEEVKAIQEAYKLAVKRFRNIGMGTVLLFIALVNQRVSLQIVYFILWTTGMCITLVLVPMPYHKRLKTLKAEKGWLVGRKQEILIDTKVTQLKNKLSISKKWFLTLFIFPVLSLFFCFGLKEKVYIYEELIFIGTQLGTVFLFIGINHLCQKLRTKVYSTNSEINYLVNKLEKNGITYALLFGGISTGLILLLTQLCVFQILRWNGVIMVLVIGSIASLQVGVMLASYKYVHYQIEKLTVVDQQALIVDEDVYWINGQIYCNSKDPALFVNKRVGIGSTINMGNPKGKIFTGVVTAFIVVILAYSVGTIVILDFSTPVISFKDNGQVEIHYPMYNENFNTEDMQEIELIESLPPTSKVNGVSTDEYGRGNFFMKGYGQVKGYWYTQVAPYIIIKLEDKTIVLGEAQPEKTQALYEEFLKARK